MCRSVPQMPARSTRISTSLIPIVGLGTSSSHSPGSRLLLTSAFMASTSLARAQAWAQVEGKSLKITHVLKPHTKVLLLRLVAGVGEGVGLSRIRMEVSRMMARAGPLDGEPNHHRHCRARRA